LPSLNIAWDTTDNTVVRFAYSKTVTRPDPVDLRQALDIDQDVFNAADPDPDNDGDRDGDSGNPDLGIVTYTISRPVNTEGGDIKGAEFSMHQPFDAFSDGFWSYFGVTASLTYVDAELDAVRDAGQPVMLRGTSKWSGNIVGYFEKNAWGVRLAYNYRDDFLHQEGEAPDDYDEYTLGTEYVDLNVDWRINKHWRIRFSANNLTDSQRHRVYRAQVNDYLNSLNDSGRTYVLELRAGM